jgi:hypothetical protein
MLASGRRYRDRPSEEGNAISNRRRLRPTPAITRASDRTTRTDGHPHFEYVIRLKTEGKILAGGLPVGDREFVFIIEAPSNDEADRRP